MKHKTILILGDSTSMTIGMEREMYPYHLACMKNWPLGTRIVNCSLPGFTSADACAFFFRNKKKLEPLEAVIIYLGNCDAASSELRKGKYSLSRQWRDHIYSICGKKRPKTRLKNRLLHFEWNNDLDNTIEAPEHPKDFDYNISGIVSASRRMNIPVILIRPRAHILFPAGIGKGNFVFYKYLGINDKLSDRILIKDSRFKEALWFHENKEFARAKEAYKKILLYSGPISSNLEYQSLIVNNYAVCAAETGCLEESEHLFNLLLKERGARKEIILYNLAQISLLKGNTQEYDCRLMEAYEADQSMYRVREAYKYVIDKIAMKFSNVSMIDLEDFIDDDDYVDHCHPLPEKQRLIAEHVAEKLHIPRLKGYEPLVIENQLYNPEYSLGNREEFNYYFRTFAPFRSDEIENFFSQIKVFSSRSQISLDDWDILSEDIPRTIRFAIEYYLKHPCFPQIQDIIIARPFLPSDVGRFPEYFIFRYLIPYLKTVEKTQKLKEFLSALEGLLRRSDQFISILPESMSDNIERNDFVFDPEYEAIRLPAILEKVKVMLLHHLKQGNQIYERMKTTIFWYFRETLRFGSHSRISMRYERIPLEFMAEALAVAGVLDFNLGNKMCFEIQSLIGWLKETVQTHEYFCRQFSLKRDCRNILAQYDLKLMDIVKKIEEAPSQVPSHHEMENG